MITLLEHNWVKQETALSYLIAEGVDVLQTALTRDRLGEFHR